MCFSLPFLSFVVSRFCAASSPLAFCLAHEWTRSRSFKLKLRCQLIINHVSFRSSRLAVVWPQINGAHMAYRGRVQSRSRLRMRTQMKTQKSRAILHLSSQLQSRRKIDKKKRRKRNAKMWSKNKTRHQMNRVVYFFSVASTSHYIVPNQSMAMFCLGWLFHWLVAGSARCSCDHRLLLFVSYFYFTIDWFHRRVKKKSYDCITFGLDWQQSICFFLPFVVCSSHFDWTE